MNVPAAQRITSREFLNWAARQSTGRYELFRGRVVAMAPERLRHVIAKTRIWRAVTEEVEQAGLPCLVYGDGAAVVVDDEHTREPDLAVECGGYSDPDQLALSAPVILVEVSSPATVSVDQINKLVEYFSVPTVHITSSWTWRRVQ